MEQVPVPFVSTKKLGFPLKIISVVAVLGIISGGALLATRVFDPIWSPFRTSPAKVIPAMIEKMQEIKTFHSEVKFNADMKGEDPGKLTVSSSGSLDINEPQNVKTDEIFEVLFSSKNIGDIGEVFFAKFNLKTIGREIYFNISELDSPSLFFLFAMVGINSNDAVGNWIKFPIENKSGEDSKLEQVPSLTEQARKIISESSFCVFKKQLSDQKIEGQKMYRYLIALDNEKTAQLVSDLELLQPEKFNTEAGTLKTKEEIFELLNNIGEISAELLIGKNDYFLYGLKIEKNIDLSKFDFGQNLLDIYFEINNSKFNQPVNIEMPVNYKTFEEVFLPLITSVFKNLME